MFFILAELSVNEIMNGNGATFKGILPILREYLDLKKSEVSEQTRNVLDRYLRLFELRASGELPTPASWMRKFVREHPSYEFDSKINDEINYDLLWKIQRISSGQEKCPELLADLY